MSDTREARSVVVRRTQQARQAAIVELVLRRGSVGMEDICNHVGVSVMTVYRDISALEEAGLLQRDRGRVTAVASGLHEASAAFRLEQLPEVKAALADVVAPRIKPGSSLMLDDSTSGILVLRALRPDIRLTVITNSLLVARETNAMPNVKLFMTGGEYQGWADALMGPTALRTLSDLDADFCVLSASGLEGGRCFHPYEDVAAVKQAMMQVSRFSILLLDNAKLHRHALHSFARLKDFDLVVVDGQTSPKDLAQLKDWETNVEVAKGPHRMR